MEELNKEGTDQNQEQPKTFTQQELDNLIESRLSREKAKYSDYNSLKKEVEELRNLKPKLGELEARASMADTYENHLKLNLEETINSLSDEYKQLIPDSLNLTEKLSFVKKLTTIKTSQVVAHTPAPKTPEIIKKDTTQPPGIPPQYKDLNDWAKHDREGYIKWRGSKFI